MKFATVATGAVNGYLAVKLASAGADVACLARGAHLEAIRADGLRLAGPEGEEVGRPRVASDDPAEIGPVDVILFAVKAQDLDAVAPLCRPMIGEGTAVIPFLNGVEARERLETLLGAGPVMEGTCGISAFLAGPGKVDWGSSFAWFRFAEADGSRSERAKAIAEAMQAAGIDAQVSDDIRAALWRKFMMLATLAGITATGRCAAGDIQQSAPLARLARESIEEIGRLARAEGVAIAKEDEARTLEQLLGMAPGIRASMARDLEAGRPLEADWLSGAVARLSERHGLEASAHRTMHALLTPWIGGGRAG
ncbi:MAG: ketopantoate reductase family protein [Pseudomonadota bacterium]